MKNKIQVVKLQSSTIFNFQDKVFFLGDKVLVKIVITKFLCLDSVWSRQNLGPKPRHTGI